MIVPSFSGSLLNLLRIWTSLPLVLNTELLALVAQVSIFEHNADVPIASLEPILEFILLLFEALAPPKYRGLEWHTIHDIHLPNSRQVRRYATVVSAADILQVFKVDAHTASYCRDMYACNSASLWKGEAILHDFQVVEIHEVEDVESERKQSGLFVGLLTDAENSKAVWNAVREESFAGRIFAIDGVRRIHISVGVLALEQDVFVDLVPKLARQAQKWGVATVLFGAAIISGLHIGVNSVTHIAIMCFSRRVNGPTPGFDSLWRTGLEDLERFMLRRVEFSR
jgi:hypothetical protein